MTTLNHPAVSIQVEQAPFATEQAMLESQKLTGGNLTFIKNLLSQCLQDLAGLDSTSMPADEYMRKVSYVRGEIAAYSFLISCHDVAHRSN